MGTRKKIRRYPDRQPDEWEAVLKDVTVEPDYHEVLCGPEKMNAFADPASSPMDDLEAGETPSFLEPTQRLQLVKTIIQKKLEGPIKACVEMVICGNACPLEIARRMGISDDSVRRYLQKAIATIRECLEEQKKFGDFPVPKGKRPPVRIRLFPLDTLAERSAFQDFINQVPITYIAYRGDALFREALVLYRTGKTKKRLPAESQLSR